MSPQTRRRIGLTKRDSVTPLLKNIEGRAAKVTSGENSSTSTATSTASTTVTSKTGRTMTPWKRPPELPPDDSPDPLSREANDMDELKMGKPKGLGDRLRSETNSRRRGSRSPTPNVGIGKAASGGIVKRGAGKGLKSGTDSGFKVPEEITSPRRSSRVTAAKDAAETKSKGIEKRTDNSTAADGKGRVEKSPVVDEDGFIDIGVATDEELPEIKPNLSTNMAKKNPPPKGKSKSAAVPPVPTAAATRSKRGTAKAVEDDLIENEKDNDIVKTRGRNTAQKSTTAAQKEREKEEKAVQADGKAKGAVNGNRGGAGSAVSSQPIVMSDNDLEKEDVDDFWHKRDEVEKNRKPRMVTYGNRALKARMHNNMRSKQEHKPPAQTNPESNEVKIAFKMPEDLTSSDASSLSEEEETPKKKIKTVSPKKPKDSGFINPILKWGPLDGDSPDHLSTAISCSQKSLQVLNGSLGSPSKKRKQVEYLSDSEVSTLSVLASSPSGSFKYLDDDTYVSHEIDDSILLDTPTQAPTNICPLCGDRFDPDFLRSLSASASKKTGVRAQLERCKAHKRASAEKECRLKKYPAVDVNWRKLRSRIDKHIPHLVEVLEQKRQSAYRDVLGEETGRKSKNKGARKLFEADFQSHTPGYYGPKGAHIMLNAIMRKMADRIREVGANDRLIAGGGVSGFVQAVLVPELGVRLVMEDLNVMEAEARTIVKETVEIGEIVNDDEGSMDSDDDETDDDGDYGVGDRQGGTGKGRVWVSV